MQVRWMQELQSYFPAQVAQALSGLPAQLLERVDEIRLRAHRPVMLQLGPEDMVLTEAKGPIAQRVMVDQQDLTQTLARVCKQSLYAFSQQISHGFVTLGGGYRVGIAGRVHAKGGVVESIPDCSGLNFRIMREKIGCANMVLPWIRQEQKLLSTLVISPPMMGKTTLLRDIARQASDGAVGQIGQKVCLIDERCELAGAWMGVAQLDVGLRTDVLDGCPKVAGIDMALRTLSPNILVMDEIGTMEEAQALLQALHAGVTSLASVHGLDERDVQRRPGISLLIDHGAFERFVVLGGRCGQVTAILDHTLQPLWKRVA